jgi:hypothetical protein
MYAYDTIYNDADPDQIETLAPTQMHRDVDLALLNADKQGVSDFIIVSSTTTDGSSGRLCERLYRSSVDDLRRRHWKTRRTWCPKRPFYPDPCFG